MAFVKVTKAGLKPAEVQQSEEEELHYNADNMFGEMCVSNLQEKEAVNNVDQVFDEIREPNTSLNQALHKDIQSSVPDLTVVAPLPSAQKVLDELPLPDFIKEMVQAASIIAESTPEPIAAEIHIDDDSFEENVHSTHEVVHVEQEVSLESKHQMFSKLSALVGPYCCDLLTLGAKQERFPKLQGVLHVADKLLLPDEHCNGNSTLKCPCLQVKDDSLMVLYALPSTSLAKNVALPLLLGDEDWFLDSSLSKNFEVQVYNTIVSAVGRRTFFNFKELQSWGIHQVWWDCPLSKLNDKFVWEWCDTMIPSLKHISGLAYINSLLKHNFDLVGKRLEVLLKGCDEGLIDNLYFGRTLYHEEIMPQVKIFDPGLMVRDVVGVLHVISSFSVMSCKAEGIDVPLRGHIEGGYTTFAVMIVHDTNHYTNVVFQMEVYDSGIIKKVVILSNVSDSICGTFQSKRTGLSLTLEDKANIEEVGYDSVDIDTFGMESHYKLFDPGISVIKALVFHNLILADKDD